jgi:hypothetical protein
MEKFSMTQKNGRKWLNSISAISALLISLILAIGILDFLKRAEYISPLRLWLAPLVDNWLVVIRDLLAGVGGISITRLTQINLLDISILFLTGLSFTGLYLSLRKTSRVWSLIALALPFLGIVVFLATRTAGRSAFMAAILIICLVMFWSKLFNKAVPIIGLAASILLFMGDFTAGSPHPGAIAVMFSLGYLLAIIWFALISRWLLKFANADDL